MHLRQARRPRLDLRHIHLISHTSNMSTNPSLTPATRGTGRKIRAAVVLGRTAVLPPGYAVAPRATDLGARAGCRRSCGGPVIRDLGQRTRGVELLEQHRSGRRIVLQQPDGASTGPTAQRGRLATGLVVNGLQLQRAGDPSRRTTGTINATAPDAAGPSSRTPHRCKYRAARAGSEPTHRRPDSPKYRTCEVASSAGTVRPATLGPSAPCPTSLSQTRTLRPGDLG